MVARTAAADIFSYTDERGVIHYTNVPSDSRYQVVLAAPRNEDARPAPTVPINETLLQKAERYAPLIEEAARASSIEPALVRAVLVVESAGDPAYQRLQILLSRPRWVGVRVVVAGPAVDCGQKVHNLLADGYVLIPVGNLR